MNTPLNIIWSYNKKTIICIYINLYFENYIIYFNIYIYQHMPRGAVMAPLREGVLK
jgi:hypothetical protein